MVEEFRCDICNKTFKKENQLKNHTESKKHREKEAAFIEEVKLDDKTEQEIIDRREEEKKLEEEEEDGE